MSPAQIAHVVHEANRALQIEQDDPTIGVNPPWEDLDQEIRDSAVDGVLGVLAGNTPQESHENWLAFKEAHGWAYGEVKNASLRTHPCMVPYDDLPPSQRVKDHLFVNIVRVLENA